MNICVTGKIWINSVDCTNIYLLVLMLYLCKMLPLEKNRIKDLQKLPVCACVCVCTPESIIISKKSLMMTKMVVQ